MPTKIMHSEAPPPANLNPSNSANKTSAFRSYPKNEQSSDEAAHKQKIENIIAYIIEAQLLKSKTNKSVHLESIAENRFFHPIRETPALHATALDLKREFKPHVNAKQPKEGEKKEEKEVHPTNVQFFQLKSLIIPDREESPERTRLPSLTPPSLPPRKPSLIEDNYSPVVIEKPVLIVPKVVHAEKAPQRKPSRTKKTKRRILEERHLFQPKNEQDTRKTVENWLENIRPYYHSNKLANVTTSPLNHGPHLHTSYPMHFKANQRPVPVKTAAYQVGQPIYETFLNYSEMPPQAPYLDYRYFNYYRF